MSSHEYLVRKGDLLLLLLKHLLRELDMLHGCIYIGVFQPVHLCDRGFCNRLTRPKGPFPRLCYFYDMSKYKIKGEQRAHCKYFRFLRKHYKTLDHVKQYIKHKIIVNKYLPLLLFCFTLKIRIQKWKTNKPYK